LKTKQVRPQRRLLGGESAVEEGDRISPSLFTYFLFFTGCHLESELVVGACFQFVFHILLVVHLVILLLYSERHIL